MKKFLMLLCTSILIFLSVGCQKYKTYTQITYNQLKEKMNAGESFVIVFGSSTCSACAQYKITMEKVIKDKQIEIFYIDINAATSEEYSKIKSEFLVMGTPTTVFIKNGERMYADDRIDENTDYYEIIKKLERYGYLEAK